MKVDDDPSGAVFADGRAHRLYLWRRWKKSGPWVMFIGLNPSTADESLNDPTIRRCISFAWKWGYSGMFMCNAYTLVSTNPKKLNAEAPIARAASLAMRVIRRRCEEAVAGWGNQIVLVRGWEDRVDRLKRDLEPLHCLGVTKSGHPRHPLYLPYNAQRISLER
ncbi:hypothetical protein LCGC14_3155750 [marine sediment metagenome]|uniref:DUF1643 domain-containing protein n=1 Tax=marine sediment metagenome TaxID=412755 RepID=A0A0F8YHA1_9ZZZZ